MKKTKIANLDSESLYEMGEAMKIQRVQLDELEAEKEAVSDGLDYIDEVHRETGELAKEVSRLTDDLFASLEKNSDLSVFENILSDAEKKIEDTNVKTDRIKRTKTIQVGSNWESYLKEYRAFAQEYGISFKNDPFLDALSQKEYEQLQKEINDDFAKKTSIINKIDLSFLAIATALQVTKSLLFPLVAQKVGYGESFDKEARLKENDKSIIDEEKRARNEYRDKKLGQGNESGEWIEFLYRTPPYDITKGSPAINFNMEGMYHRIHTLGHDPILGWIFGTMNILTDTVTFDSFATYKVARNPMMITPDRVPLISLFSQTVEKSKEGLLNLPAALVAEKIHLKSDEFTKCGLPIPILETFAPEFAGKLYKNQYDALCFSRDLKVIGTSAAISMFIDMIIGLVHALYYNKEKDGTKDMFEIRTRKILLISNAIASTSNIIYTAVTKNPKNLDIGGLLVTISHLFLDTRFILNVKKEFIENRIYEKIESDIQSIEKNQNKLFEYGFKHEHRI